MQVTGRGAHSAGFELRIRNSLRSDALSGHRKRLCGSLALAAAVRGRHSPRCRTRHGLRPALSYFMPAFTVEELSTNSRTKPRLMPVLAAQGGNTGVRSCLGLQWGGPHLPEEEPLAEP